MNNKQKFTTIALTAMFIVLAQFTMVAQNDRATFGLKGNVTKVTQNVGEYGDSSYFLSGSGFEKFNLEFSKSGKLTKVEGNDIRAEISDRGEKNYVEFYGDENEIGGSEPYGGMVIYRDAQNRITTFYYAIVGEGCDSVIYDNKGRVSQIISMFLDYESEKEKYVEARNIKYFYDDNNNVIKEVLYDLEKKETYTRTYKYESFDKTGNWLTRRVNCEYFDVKDEMETRTVEY